SKEAETHPGRLWSFFERFFDGMLHVYDRTLQFTLRHRVATMAVSAAVAVATVYMFIVIPKGFLPDEDQGQIFIFTEGPQGISFDSMVEHQLALTQDVTSDLQIKNPQVNVDIDRDKASSLGVTAQQVEDALYSAYGQRQVSTIYAPNNAYRVITELENQYQLDPSALSMLYVRSSSGQLVPLNAVAKLTRTVGPLTINHLGQLPAVTVSFNLRPGVSLGDAVNAVNK